MNCKYDSSTFDHTRTKKNLGLILKISILLAFVNFGIRFVQTDRPEVKSKGTVPLSSLNWIFVQKVRGSQVMMIMATNILWTTIESEVFRSQKTQGIIHWLLILPKFFGILPLIVKCLPKLDLQDGILALALLNILWALLVGYLLGKRNMNETTEDLPTEDRYPGDLWTRPWDDDHYGGTSGPSSARSRAGPESPLLPRIPSV
ncbi:hypothetical protein MACK_001554 [Theileria orientalis]|uniref:Uncharacterized protein n=1 Tax=Theileria orientalis TaxID=68886 RepID=A0A976QTJ7_THEOR|nr:hypothetical protein MACK_001554 [Theileria orientalis]